MITMIFWNFPLGLSHKKRVSDCRMLYNPCYATSCESRTYKPGLLTSYHTGWFSKQGKKVHLMQPRHQEATPHSNVQRTAACAWRVLPPGVGGQVNLQPLGCASATARSAAIGSWPPNMAAPAKSKRFSAWASPLLQCFFCSTHPCPSSFQATNEPLPKPVKNTAALSHLRQNCNGHSLLRQHTVQHNQRNKNPSDTLLALRWCNPRGKLPTVTVLRTPFTCAANSKRCNDQPLRFQSRLPVL